MATVTLKPGKLNNRVDPIQQGVIDPRDPTLSAVVVAENFDFDNAGKASTRKGRVSRYSGIPHSLKTLHNKPETYFVDAGVLKSFTATYATATVATLSSNLPLFYEPVNQETVVSNGVDIGWLGGGQYDAFSQTLGAFELAMPAGQFLAFYRGVLYVAAGNVIYFSKPNNIMVRDSRLSEIPLDGYIRMLAAVEDGLWAATDNRVVFMAGQGAEDFVYREITSNSPPNGAFASGWEETEGNVRKAVSWVSKEGMCYGRAGGAYENKSYPDIALPSGASGVCFRRVENGIDQTIAVVRTLGEDSAYTAPTLTINSITVT